MAGAAEIDLTSTIFAVGGISGGAIPLVRQNSDAKSSASKCIMLEVPHDHDRGHVMIEIRTTRRLRWVGEASKETLAGRARAGSQAWRRGRASRCWTATVTLAMSGRVIKCPPP